MKNVPLGLSGTVGGQGFGSGNQFKKLSAMCDEKSATHHIFVEKGLQQTGKGRVQSRKKIVTLSLRGGLRLCVKWSKVFPFYEGEVEGGATP